MTDHRPRISSHPANDDLRHWEFVRRSGLRAGDFKMPWRLRQVGADHVVFGACLVALAAAFIIVAFVEG